MNKLFLILWLMLSHTIVHAEETEIIQISDFATVGIDDWQEKEFSQKTTYQVIQLDNQAVLKAHSQNSASGLVKKIRIDLKQYPYLNWRWQTEQSLNTENEQTKSGDDYAARIYVIIDGGLFFWRTKALNYVWANRSPKESTWPNAFAGKSAMMIALKNHEDDTQTWYVEKRNVYKDLKKAFGKEIRFIDAIALMTDTDNSHNTAKSYYSDIYFSSK